MKTFIEFLNEAAGNYTVQIGFEPSMEKELKDMAKEGKVTVKRTNNKPIDPRDATGAQYLVSGSKKAVVAFLDDYGFDYYKENKFVVKNS